MGKTRSDREPIHVGRVVQNALVFGTKRWREEMLGSSELLDTVRRLFGLIEDREVEYLLVGGIALLCYVEGRSFEVIELIVSREALEQLPEVEVLDQNPDFVRARFEGLRVDVLLTDNPLFAKVRSDYATRQSFAERELPCATVEGLLLLKLYALPSLYRQGDFTRVSLYENDVAALMEAYEPSLPPLLEVLHGHMLGTDVASLRQIVEDIESRIERFRERSARPLPLET